MVYDKSSLSVKGPSAVAGTGGPGPLVAAQVSAVSGDQLTCPMWLPEG